MNFFTDIENFFKDLPADVEGFFGKVSPKLQAVISDTQAVLSELSAGLTAAGETGAARVVSGIMSALSTAGAAVTAETSAATLLAQATIVGNAVVMALPGLQVKSAGLKNSIAKGISQATSVVAALQAAAVTAPAPAAS
jgi:hypothetical protein